MGYEFFCNALFVAYVELIILEGAHIVKYNLTADM